MSFADDLRNYKSEKPKEDLNRIREICNSITLEKIREDCKKAASYRKKEAKICNECPRTGNSGGWPSFYVHYRKSLFGESKISFSSEESKKIVEETIGKKIASLGLTLVSVSSGTSGEYGYYTNYICVEVRW